MLEHVDVEVDGGVEGGEQVGDAGHVLHPGRPDHLLALLNLEQLVDIGNPLDAVADDEHCNNATTDLGESDFSLVKASAWNYSAHFTNLSVNGDVEEDEKK